ncbi:MAG: hypothetical protein AMJ90_04365 [candidate division Zixibacteria bacterium SM23_73_2]|nr:MAG: hypothetical protein AMJ90_04365 [candidate division Zixibacteria bacterium SM23_73_2]
MSFYNDPEIPIKVILGQTFTISLESIPSTGYTWEANYDSTVIELLKPQRFVPNTSAVGGSGLELFDFQTKQHGKTQIKMKMQREWEETPKEVKIFEVHIE